ncbi:hypothetical protein DPSP01_002119 [Paraphaeosphaeria sporulosa]|uniref:Zincin n=1 Tax=Paraphaeosphaeria sporulosa TaxID=1460663 RepID=A0A177CZM6_9PLEO|nr:zincin [Paraphaeosphaeria sporulosa]OAG12417.1 zincin [Paraphaeosphaeria sporulosa]
MKLSPLFTLLGSATAASFVGCTAPQTATIEKAILRATERAYAVVEHLEANPNGSALQTAYYGTFDKTRYAKILAAFRKMAPDLDAVFTYECGCTSNVVIAYPSNTYGYTTICSVYFNEAVIPAEGFRSQWSTLIHEATHFRDLLDTRDYGYTPDVCKQFAKEDPVKAVGNADNHANFAVEV